MAKVKKAFFCKNCGFEAPKWLGRCPSCGEWNTFAEEIIARLQLSQASLENLEAAGHAGMTTSQSLRELLPAFNQWDLKSNEIGMSHELCVRGTASANDEPASLITTSCLKRRAGVWTCSAAVFDSPDKINVATTWTWTFKAARPSGPTCATTTACSP